MTDLKSFPTRDADYAIYFFAQAELAVLPVARIAERRENDFRWVVKPCSRSVGTQF